jgi:hypothetical protein
MTMTDLSNKPISYTGSHPLELAYRALLARAEAAEAEAVDLHRQLTEMATAMEEIEDERLSLAARVNAGAWDTGGRGLETPTRTDRIVTMFVI